jgi:selenocysteine lyase/cysteine desulfurase
MIEAAELYARPNAIAGDYSLFRVSERLLLTGHSHQAWPDAGFEGQTEAWRDAAEYVDEKWGHAFAKAGAVKRGFARLLGDPAADLALAQNTHELVVRLLSALRLDERPRIVTTDGEFHSIRRQLDRMAEDEFVELVKVAWDPVDTLAARLSDAVNDRTAVVMASIVSFRNAQIMTGLGDLATACGRHGAELLVDAYHALAAMPFSIPGLGIDNAFIVGGGYKYCQLGEGNCFLRVPPDCTMRPVITGWYAEFDALAEAGDGERVAYGSGASRFAGSTYDPTSHYRAAAVFDYFADTGLTPELLREVSQHQVGLLADRFDAMDADPALATRDRTVALNGLGGFFVVTTPRAADISAALAERGVATDYRGDALRFGPAPYLCDEQLHAAMDALAEVLEGL